jgi:hypothetical protein
MLANLGAQLLQNIANQNPRININPIPPANANALALVPYQQENPGLHLPKQIP